jgi:hypothetical protein
MVAAAVGAAVVVADAAAIVGTGVVVVTAEIVATAGKPVSSFSWRRESWPVPLSTLFNAYLAIALLDSSRTGTYCSF